MTGDAKSRTYFEARKPIMEASKNWRRIREPLFKYQEEYLPSNLATAVKKLSETKNRSAARTS